MDDFSHSYDEKDREFGPEAHRRQADGEVVVDRRAIRGDASEADDATGHSPDGEERRNGERRRAVRTSSGI